MSQTEISTGSLCISCFQPSPFHFCMHCDPNRINCRFCKIKFETFDSFIAHIDTSHSKMLFRKPLKRIPASKRLFSFEINLKEEKIVLYICPSCKFIRQTTKELVIHISKVHTLRQFQCAHCDKSFRRKYHLRCHIYRHINGLNSDTSGKGCSRVSLKRGVLTHNNLNTYTCSVCDKNFAHAYSLKRHVRQHSAEKNYRCEECDKSFSYDSAFKRHQKLHSTIELFECTICLNKYRWKSDLIRHMRNHTGEKSFHCSICDKAFARKSCYEEHRLKHSESKMYICFCGKVYRFKSCLSRHKATHKLEK